MSSGATWSAAFGGASTEAMQAYDDVLVPRVFEPWARLLIDQLELALGDAVLDVACGPGSVSRIAAERVGAGGRVTACDLSPAMLALAREKPAVEGAASIEYLEAPADQLPVGCASYDVVTCQQGLQFFGDRPAAVAQMHRALRPGGRVGIAVWTEISRSASWAQVADAVEEVAGAELADRYRGGPWGFPDAGPIAELLEQAGFEDVRVSTHTLPVTYEGGAEQLYRTLAASGIAEQLDALADEQQRQLAEVLTRIVGEGQIDSTLESNVAIAAR
jgi:ubiquinone/menaquinone biosynthesis C-methylase UbiE